MSRRAVCSLALWVASCVCATRPLAAELDEAARAMLDRATLRFDPGHHTAQATSIAATSDGARIVTGSEDRTVRLWDAKSGELLRTLRPPSAIVGDEGRIYAVAVSPDGKIVAVGGNTRFYDDRYQRGCSVYLFDAGSGALVRRLVGSTSGQRESRIDQLVFSPDGKRLAVRRSADRSLGVYDVATGATLDDSVEQQAIYFTDVSFDNAGNLLVSRRGALLFFDGALRKLGEHRELSPVRGARYLPDGKQLVLLHEDGQIELRRQPPLNQNKLVLLGAAMPKFPSLERLLTSSDGKYVYVTAKRPDAGRAVVRRLAIATGEGRDTELPFAAVNALAELPQDAIAFAAPDGSWGIIEADGAVHRYGVSRVFDAAPDALLVDATGDEIELRLGPKPTERLRFSVSSLELRAAATADPRLRPPNVEPRAPHRITGWRHSPPVLVDDAGVLPVYEDPAALAISPSHDGFLLGTSRQLLGYRYERGANDGCPRPAAAKGQTPAACFVVQSRSPVRAVNYSGDGRYALALHADGTVRWYDARDGSERLILYARPGDARWLLFRPDGVYAASPTGAELAGFQLNDPEERAPDFFPLSRLKQSLERPEQVAATLGATPAISTAAAPAPTGATGLRAEQLPPLLTILEPADGALVNSQSITIKVALRSLSGQPATALRVRVDGRPVEVAQPRGIIDLGAKSSAPPPATPRSDGERPLSINVTLPPRDCVVAVYAENSAGAGPPALLRLRVRDAASTAAATVTKPGAPKPVSAPPPTGSLRVLAIGVDDYKQAELRLRYPGKDARDLAALIKDLHGGKAGAPRLYQSVDMRVLTGREATKAAILEALDWLQHRAAASDTSILFLAGHGINEPSTGEYYFLPVDADVGSALRTMLPASTLRQVLSSVQGRIVLLLDTCHSGNVLSSGRKTRGVPPLSRAIAELASVDSGIVVMAAATGEQQSIEDTAWQNGAFAKALIEGLSGRADLRHTGRVTVNMLDLYISERVRELTDGTQTPATAKPTTIADFPLVLSR